MRSLFELRIAFVQRLMCAALLGPICMALTPELAIAASSAASTPSGSAAIEAAPVQEISPAEIMLFQTHHLKNIRNPADLTYAYKKVNESGPPVLDQVHLDVTKINPDGSATASLRFLTGTRKLEIPEVKNSEGNPVILGFLEWDIGQMKQHTGGSTNYFRKRIRMALADAAHVRQIVFPYNGKSLDGNEISIQPYRDDPMHARFEKYVNKRYTFILSDSIPGGVYQIRTTLSNDIPRVANVNLTAGNAQNEESITLVKQENLKH